MLVVSILLGFVVARTYENYTFIVIGDSEIASGKGYGDCLKTYLPGAEVLNFALSGYTTSRWLNDTAQRELTIGSAMEAVARGRQVICSQAFGANDEKAEAYAHVDRKAFLANMLMIHNELKTVCTFAAISTPYNRRWFNAKGIFQENGGMYAELSRFVARGTNSVLIDLHNVSASYLRTWTPEKAYEMNLKSEDRTHLNEFGCNLTAFWWAAQFNRVFFNETQNSKRRRSFYKKRA